MLLKKDRDKLNSKSKHHVIPCDRGPRGFPGKPGEEGMRGATGKRGPKGDKGDPGTSDVDIFIKDLDILEEKVKVLEHSAGGNGNGDMTKTVYDMNDNGIVDNSEKLEGHPASYFALASHTHTASEITDFDTEVSNNVDVAANTAARHSHANKTLLDSLTSSGTGDSYLADDGTYKAITVPSVPDEVIGFPGELPETGVPDTLYIRKDQNRLFFWDETPSTPAFVEFEPKPHNHDTLYAPIDHTHSYDELTNLPTLYEGWDVVDAAGTPQRIGNNQDLQIVGSGATTVTIADDPGGAIVTISSTDTNTNTNYYLDGVTVDSALQATFSLAGGGTDVGPVNFNHALGIHTDVVIGTATQGQVLTMNDSGVWVNADIDFPDPPSVPDEVISVANEAGLPASAPNDVIYITIDTMFLWTWNAAANEGAGAW